MGWPCQGVQNRQYRAVTFVTLMNGQVKISTGREPDSSRRLANQRRLASRPLIQR